MCIITSPDLEKENMRPIYLAVENGRYVPAPPKMYVPGLRQIFRKQALKNPPRQALFARWPENMTSRSAIRPEG